MEKRRSIRLKDYDYSQPNGYFITICTNKKALYFEKYPALKEIVMNQWLDIPIRFKNVVLDEYVIMPNHIHGIIFIEPAEATDRQGQALPLHCCPNNVVTKQVGTTLGNVIGAYKSLCVNEWIKVGATLVVARHNGIRHDINIWHRNYYEHIIRNESDLNKIRKYIIENPLKWDLDKENPKHIEGEKNHGIIL